MNKRPGIFDGVVIDESAAIEPADIDRAMSQVRDYGQRYPIEITLGTPRPDRQFMITVPGTEAAAVDLQVLKPRRRQS